MLPIDPDQLSPTEQEALDGLPREREPSLMLEERTVRALRSEGLFRPVRGRGINPHGPFGWLAAGIAAALVLFTSGVVVGQWMGTRSTVEVIVAVEEANAREVAALVQQTGSQYAAALAALTQVPSSASDSNWVAQGREVALTLLIFLGLLGTFWGLLQTIDAVADTIATLSPTSDDFSSFFSDLQAGLQAPLAGMGIAFSSSLFGLAGSLVLGFLELQAGQAQSRFYMDFEEWLSTHTRLAGGGPAGLEGEGSVPAYVQALLEQTAESLDSLQRVIARSEEGRVTSQAAIMALSDNLANLTDQMRGEQEHLRRLGDVQADLRPALERLAQGSERERGGLDEASRNHLRNLDVYVMRLLEEASQGRNQLVSEIRSEIKLLARTIAALDEDRR